MCARSAGCFGGLCWAGLHTLAPSLLLSCSLLRAFGPCLCLRLQPAAVVLCMGVCYNACSLCRFAWDLFAGLTGMIRFAACRPFLTHWPASPKTHTETC